jgi:WD40 repeat protein
MRNRVFYVAFFIVICCSLAGCQGEKKIETIIIEDKEDQQATSDELSLFEVKTIYPVLDGKIDQVYPLGWSKENSLITLGSKDYKLSSTIDRVEYPYVSRLNLWDEKVGIFLFENLVALSPDGQKVAFPVVENGDFALKLFSLTGGNDELIGAITTDQLRFIRMTWSSNSRFLSYSLENEADKQAEIGVYDTENRNTKRYSIEQKDPYLKESVALHSVHVSNDGESAVIVKYQAKQLMLAIGQWSGDKFKSKYEHPISADGWVEWIHQDQIAFVGEDGNLYAYDQRNAVVSLLLRDIGLFRLSDDRKFIAFSQDGDSVFAARLYGNNVLNMKLIYQGMIPVQMAWSPDNGKLMLSGAKLYEIAQPMSETRVSKGMQSLVIEFK